MKRWSGRWPRILWALGAVLAVAALTHGAVLWALPRVIMHRTLQAVAGDAPPAATRPSITDHTQRRIVMPSPDLLYSTCVWDVSKQALRIRAHPQWPRYWSIALYSDNSDNFFVLNDRQAGKDPVDLVLVGPSTAPVSVPPGARTVRAPASRGLLLMRVLIANRDADATAATAARDSLSCEALAPP